MNRKILFEMLREKFSETNIRMMFSRGRLSNNAKLFIAEKFSAKGIKFTAAELENLLDDRKSDADND